MGLAEAVRPVISGTQNKFLISCDYCQFTLHTYLSD